MNTSIKTVFIKIAKRIYTDGIPLSSGFGSQPGARKPIFEGLFEIAYSNPTVDPDGTIRISCNGDVSKVKYSVSNISGMTRISGEMQQGLVGGIFLPSDDFVQSTKKNIGDYLRNTARISEESKIDNIINRLMEDIVNNVPVKAIYKTLKQDSPSDFGRVSALYRQKYKIEILSNLEEMVTKQATYSTRLAHGNSMFIKTAADNKFDKGDTISLDNTYMEQKIKALIDEKEKKRFIDEIKKIKQQMSDKGIDPKQIKYKNESTKNKGYAVVVGYDEDETAFPFEVPSFLISKYTGRNANSSTKQKLKELGVSIEDLSRIDSYITESGLSSNAFVALVAEAKETKPNILKDDQINMGQFRKLLSSGWGNIADRAEVQKMDKETYYQALQAAGEQGISFKKYVSNWKEKQQAGQDEEQKTKDAEDEKSSEAQRESVKNLQAYKANPDKMLFAELKKAGINIYNQGRPDLIKAVPFRNAISDFYKKSSPEKQALFPKDFVNIVQGLQGGVNFSKSVMRYFDIPEEALKNTKVLLANFGEFANMIKALKKNLKPEDIPRTILSVYEHNLLQFGNDLIKAGLKQQGLDPNMLRNKSVAIQNVDKIRAIYKNVTDNLPDYKNDSIEDVFKAATAAKNIKNIPVGGKLPTGVPKAGV